MILEKTFSLSVQRLQKPVVKERGGESRNNEIINFKVFRFMSEWSKITRNEIM